MRALVISLVVLTGCPSKSEPPAAVPPPAPRDAGIDGVTTIAGFDPASGMHLDDDTPARPPSTRPQPKLVHPVDIILRSSPSGARAAVDGTEIDRTPTFVQVEAGRPHEFTFNLEGHAFARYRFVPVTSGVVHARMEPIAEDVDAGVAVPLEVVPLAPPLPPDTLVTPRIDAPVGPVAPPPGDAADPGHSVGPVP